MANDYEDEIRDDLDAICGWGAADFDEELETRSRRKAVKKVITKPKLQKALSTSKFASGMVTLRNATDSRLSQEKQLEKLIEPLPKQAQQSQNWSENHQSQRKAKAQHHQQTKDHSSTKPSPRTLSLKKENAAIAASGRERRMKIVAAAMASNVPRKSGVGSVVSAAFDDDSDKEQESKRKPDECMPSSAPQSQLKEKLPRVHEPSTAPANSLPIKLNPPAPLPLLSIQPGCGGNETRLFGNGAPPPEAPQHWRQHRKLKQSLLPSRDVADNWESNFPPALRRSRSPKEYQAELPSSSPTKTGRQEYSTPVHLEESLPSIHHTVKSDAASAQISNTQAATLNNVKDAHRDTKLGEYDDDESWTKCYDDPELLAKSMAGLIQALSTFAADGKHLKASSKGKNKRRRAKRQVQQQALPAPPPRLRLPPPTEITVTSDRAANPTEVSEPIARRRKHRKIRNKQHET